METLKLNYMRLEQNYESLFMENNDLNKKKCIIYKECI